jgi:cell shape-determining protein MreD
MNAFTLRAPDHRVLRAWGFALAVASVILPSLPLGDFFAQPPIPLAVLWAAYGWAAEDESGWRAPLTLAVLGLIHDQLAGGPYGLFVVLYLSAYLAGRVFGVLMSSPNLFSLWGGFAATTLLTIGIAYFVAPLGLGQNVSIGPYAEACAITIVLFPLVRSLYMSASPGARVQQGARR